RAGPAGAAAPTAGPPAGAAAPGARAASDAPVPTAARVGPVGTAGPAPRSAAGAPGWDAPPSAPDRSPRAAEGRSQADPASPWWSASLEDERPPAPSSPAHSIPPP